MYQHELIEKLGCQNLKEALSLLNNELEPQRKYGCEHFFVYFCEDARFRAIQYQISEGLKVGLGKDFDVPSTRDLKVFSWVHSPVYPDRVDDIMILVSPKHSSDFEGDKDCFKYLWDLIHNWRKLSDAWCWEFFVLQGLQLHLKKLLKALLKEGEVVNY
ncbi:unnamed protein product [Cuscuta campestris]|uniref:Uncharacterized protein n=1 Tax=Cuscuta campestris TaxID=132261 RepID=A0A484L1V9_9ASTE|nr:unnamed protein product [Cuscuta campestris]